MEKINYEIIVDGVSYPLPQYTIKIAEELDALELVCQSNAKFREKCKKMYDMIIKLIGKENVDELIGNLDDADPNTLNMLYLNIVKVYNAPVNDFQKDEIHNTLSEVPIDKIASALQAIKSVK